jgi:hypothetical protein
LRLMRLMRLMRLICAHMSFLSYACFLWWRVLASSRDAI